MGISGGQSLCINGILLPMIVDLIVGMCFEKQKQDQYLLEGDVYK